MKIDYKKEYVVFADIQVSNCFEYNQYFYMKIDPARKGDYIVNAVNLASGTLEAFDLQAKVHCVNLKVVNGDYQ